MARGLAKQQSKEKHAKKQAGKKSAHDHKAARESQLKIVCTICKSQISDLRTYKQHFEAKHPKAPTPPELADV